MSLWRELLTGLDVRVLIALLLVAAFLTGLLVARMWFVAMRRRRGSRDRGRGVGLERAAEHMLRAEGFTTLERQPRFTNLLMINGDLRDFEVTPDLLVEKDGQVYVVEVKGDQTRISEAGVRRQIIEYLQAAGVPCLLVRMPEGDIDLVELPQSDQ
jgi:Holliday junction resolvase-like predicted endonuclease